MKKLRDYQLEALNAIDAAVVAGHRSGVIALATGMGKCLGKDTPVLMFDGTIKPVQEIVTGELLMGPDSKPRRVLSTVQGQGELYRVTPVKGDSYVVNDAHILSLVISGSKSVSGFAPNSVVNISVTDYLAQGSHFKHCAKGWRAGVDWEEREVSIDPYWLGLWLGDGSSRSTQIYKPDLEVRDYVIYYANKLGLRYALIEADGKCPGHAINGCNNGSNALMDRMRSYNLIQNKHIPLEYLANSRSVRMALFAGLMDSDGSRNEGGADFVFANERLANNLAQLARSLGLAAYLKPCQKTCTNNGKVGNYFRVLVSGDLSGYPVRIARKQSQPRLQVKDVLRTGITVTPNGFGEYFGFTIDGDSLFLLGDFTVTHNTVTAANAIKRRIHLGRALFTAPLDAVVSQSAVAIQAEIPGATVGIVKAQLNQVNSQIVVASLQTLAREKRIEQLADSMQSHGAFQTIVIDECHLHLDAYRKVIERLASPDTVIIGLSATPYRLDGRGLGEVFETVFAEMDIVRGIQEGYLVEPDALQFRLKGADFGKVHVRKGDFEASELEEVMKASNFAEQIAKHWKEHASDKRTVIFLPKVTMAYEMAEYLRAEGIRAEALDGGTGKGDRREIFARYERGETQVLCNVLVLSTGWDSPITECLVMARPTKSKALYLQAMGRGMRTLPRVIDGLETAEERLSAIANSAKPSCLVMDMIGVTGKHKLMTLVDLMGVAKPKERRKLTELVDDAAKEKKEEEERQRVEAELEAQRVKLIEQAERERKEKRRGFEWQTDFFNPGQERLFVRDVTLIVRQMADGSAWIAVDSQRQFHFVNGSPEACKKAAEEYAKKLLFSDPNAAWRQKPASDSQLAKLRQWRISTWEGITKGEASDLMTAYLEKRKGLP